MGNPVYYFEHTFPLFPELKILGTFDYFENTKKINYLEFLASKSKRNLMIGHCKSNDDS